MGGPLWDAIEAFVGRFEPERAWHRSARGFTDSHWMRVAFGTVAYGFYRRGSTPRRRRG